jgi:5-methylcytosine-specific restriction enzyme subunit McrC
VHPTIDWLKQVTLNRMSERYSMCLGLAKLFLRGSTSDLYGGPQDSFALLFDMNALFELYIGKVIRRTLRPLGHDVRLQHAQHHLVRDTTTKDKLFQLRPDIVVFCSGKCCCVVDTKWKQLKVAERKLGVLQADLYQMLAYAQRYDCNAVLLLYPLGAYSADHLSVRKQFATEHGTALITIGEVSLQDLKTVPEQLLELFAAAVAVQHVERSAAAP